MLTILNAASRGAEQGALQAAIDLGIAIGGWRCAGDDIPAVFAEHSRVTSSSDRGMARRLNVQDSDGTLAMSSAIAPVGVVAFLDRITEQAGSPFLSVTLGNAMPDAVRTSVLDWMRENEISRLHVTGASEADEPGIQAAVRKVMVWLLEELAAAEVKEFMGTGMKLLSDLVDTAPMRASHLGDQTK